MRSHFFTTLLIAFGGSIAVAQIPAIQTVVPLSTSSNDTLIITGSGFSTIDTNLDVWFGSVKGTIISASDFSIEVKVPAEAKLANLEVVNKVSNLSARASLKFMPSLKTESFSASDFAAPVSFTAQQELWDLCFCDLNTDGKPDIISTKFSRPNSPYLISQDVMILQNQSTPGTMAFSKMDKANLAALNLTFASDNVVCGDLNGDGKADLVVSRGSDPRNSIHIFRNTGPGGVGSAISFATQTALFLDVNHAATRIVIRDLNRDGKPDLIVTASTTDFFYVFVNQSSGGTLSFNSTPIKVDLDPAGSALRTYEPEVQDFNGDGFPDIIINRFQENNLYIFQNQSAGTISFAAPVVHPTPAERKFNRITSADFNNDGKLDVVLTNSSLLSPGQESMIYLNKSTGSAISFETDANAIKLPTEVGAWGVDVADIDGDKDTDIVVVNKDATELNVFTHNGNFSSPAFTKFNITTAPVTGPASWNSRNVKIGDLDGDGKPDIAYTGFNDASLLTSIDILRNTHCHQPEIRNAEPLTICNGQTIVLKTAAANNITYSWLKDGGAIGTNSPFLTISSAGTYRVTATNGACGLFDEIIVTADAASAPPDPVITANAPLCAGSILNLSTTTTVGGATYTWTRPNGQTLTGQNQSFTAALTDAGIYSLQLTTSVCKSDVVTKLVDVATLSSFSIASDPVSNAACQGNAVQLSVSNLANHNYQWKKDGVVITSGGTTATFAASAEGAYSVKVTNTTLNCDTETSAVQVMILQPPVAAYTVKSPACTGELLTFTNQSTFDTRITPAFAWTFGDGNTSNVTNPTKTYNTAQAFTTTLTVTYPGVTGCSGNTTKPVNITTGTAPVISSTASLLCPDENATLSVNGTFSEITWSNSGNTNSTSVTGPGIYTVSTTDINGCPGVDEITIDGKPVPVVTVSATPPEISSGESTQLLAEGADTYIWFPVESLDNPSIPNPIATPTQTTTYSVIGTATDGCPATNEIIVNVEGTLGFPQMFSPNGDGINDEWNVGANDKPSCTLNVFDVRGRRIFEGKGVNWNGTHEGKQVPNGTYYYVFSCPSERPITGNVLIVR
jgi:gliding motility-associated-like protein